MSSAIAAAAVGAALGGRLSDSLGRKTALVAADVLFAGGAVAMGLAPNAAVLVLGKPSGAAHVGETMPETGRTEGHWLGTGFSCLPSNVIVACSTPPLEHQFVMCACCRSTTFTTRHVRNAELHRPELSPLLCCRPSTSRAGCGVGFMCSPSVHLRVCAFRCAGSAGHWQRLHDHLWSIQRIS